MNGRVRASIDGTAPPAGNLGPHRAQTLAAWERFASGDDDVRGIPSSILLSWYRCRDIYKVDTKLSRPPAVRGRGSHRQPHCGVFARLGGIATNIVEHSEDCLVTVADGDGRILASWGKGSAWGRGEESSIAPFFGWSERATGTNGMGTAIVQQRQVSVRGPEHWCEVLHGWNCTGVALYDDVSRKAVAALNVSTWGDDVPVLTAGVAADLDGIRTDLRKQAVRDGIEVSQAFMEFDRTSGSALIAVDIAGNVIAANERARTLVGDLPEGFMLEPTSRWHAESSHLRNLVAQWAGELLDDPHWTGAADLGILLSGRSREFSIFPVGSGAGAIGFILASGRRNRRATVTELDVTVPETRQERQSRIVAVHEGRMLLLAPSEIRYAEADRHTVWLITDIGRMRAAARGIDHVESELSPFGFVRVHRGYLVNVGRIREISHHGKGMLTVSTQLSKNEMIPVSRRSAAILRDLFGV